MITSNSTRSGFTHSLGENNLRTGGNLNYFQPDALYSLVPGTGRNGWNDWKCVGTRSFVSTVFWLKAVALHGAEMTQEMKPIAEDPQGRLWRMSH